MAGHADLQIYQGDDWAVLVTVTGGLPPDEVIAGFQAKAQIRLGPADQNSQVAVEIQTGVASPHITLTIPSSETTGMSGWYLWDLQVTSPDGSITTLLAGKVLVTQEVTR